MQQEQGLGPLFTQPEEADPQGRACRPHLFSAPRAGDPEQRGVTLCYGCACEVLAASAPVEQHTTQHLNKPRGGPGPMCGAHATAASSLVESAQAHSA